MPTFRGKKFTDADLRATPKLEKIKRLELIKTSVTDQGMKALAAAASLREICIDSDDISDESIAVLAELPALASLLVHRAPRLLDRGLRSLSKCKGLRELYLNGTGITDRGVQHFCELPEIWSLCLDHTSISDRGCTALRGLKKLALLSLSQTRVTGKEIGGFREPKFFDVYLEQTAADDDGIVALAEHQPNLRTISLIGTPVGDRTAKALAQLPVISDIRFSGTNVTDEALTWLAGCRSLEMLYLEKTDVSPEAVQRLKKTSRKLTIFDEGRRTRG